MKLLAVVIATLLSQAASGAACCGGNFASPAIISGDEKAMLTLSLSEGDVREYVDSKGISRAQDGFRDRTAVLSGAKLLADRWQLGAMTSIKQQSRSNQDAEATKLGDTSVLLGYEAWPEWVYNPYQPHTFIFAKLVAPTGTSIYESKEKGAVDVSGNGFWTAGAGVLMTKIWSKWDAQLQAEIQKGIKRDFNSPSSGGPISVEPGWGKSVYTSVGYSIQDWRLGAGLKETQEDPMKIRGAVSSTSSQKQWTSLILTANKLISGNWAAALTYTDETLLGSPTNTFLSRTLTATLQHRWPR